MSYFTKEDYTAVMVDPTDGELMVAQVAPCDWFIEEFFDISSFYPFSNYSVEAFLMLYPQLSSRQDKLRLQLDFWMKCDDDRLSENHHWIGVDRNNKLYMR